jgi:hypothetical protein
MGVVTSGMVTAAAQVVKRSGTLASPGRPERGLTETEARKQLESSGALQRRIPCEQVVSQADHDTAARRGRAADVGAVAKQLGASATWVEQCLRAYGRRAKRADVESAEIRERRLESLEEGGDGEVRSEEGEEEGGTGQRKPLEPQMNFRDVIRAERSADQGQSGSK